MKSGPPVTVFKDFLVDYSQRYEPHTKDKVASWLASIESAQKNVPKISESVTAVIEQGGCHAESTEKCQEVDVAIEEQGGNAAAAIEQGIAGVDGEQKRQQNAAVTDKEKEILKDIKETIVKWNEQCKRLAATMEKCK